MRLGQYERVEVVCVLNQDLLRKFLLLFLGAEASDIREKDAKSSRRLHVVLLLYSLSLMMFLTFGGSLSVSVELARRKNGLLSDMWSL